MVWIRFLLLLLIVCSTLFSQVNFPKPAVERLDYEVFLIGNTGAGSKSELTNTLQLLAKKTRPLSEKSAIIFLGDFLPFKGLPEAGTAEFKLTVDRIDMIATSVSGYKGSLFFIPGDKDWADDSQNGWESIINLEKIIEKKINKGNTFLPDKGMPGPEYVKLKDDIRLLLLNTNWLLKEDQRAGNDNIKVDDDFYVELNDKILKYATKDLIIIGHHPLHSNGKYAGKYHPKSHIFPMTMIWDNAYFPLPVLGTSALSFASITGDEQYFSNKRNTWFRQSMDKILRQHDDFIYVSAHEYNQQYFQSTELGKNQNYIISGSASKTEYVAGGFKTPDTRTKFVAQDYGFSSLQFFDDGSIWLNMYSTNSKAPDNLIYQNILREPFLVTDPESINTNPAHYPDYSDSTITLKAEPDYEAGWLTRLLSGSNHRDAWTTPVSVPYFDIGREHGGLTPIKKGGGQQTTSIRLKSADNKQYVLRSVNKDGKRFLPEEYRSTFVSIAAQDFLSYAHPYGAFIVPHLADAVGVYHTNPRLVYVPRDARFGIYEDLLQNMLMLYEERPNKDMSGFPSFGNSKDVVGAPEVFRKVTNDNDYTIDARFMARSRLFDMWMSDWDRHEDQWRWASFENSSKGITYRPIPRDRDQAFNRLNFIFSPLVKPYLKFQDFRESYGSLKGLTTNGRHQDHRFLSSLSRKDWITIADSVKISLTDKEIEEAFKKWPEPIFNLHGSQMTKIGKIRRDKLAQVAEKFYELHARSIDIVGSNKHELFDVYRRDNNTTLVQVFKISKQGEIRKKIYERIIYTNETDEICLFALGGNDKFNIKGNVSAGIQIYAVGGTGKDTFIDSSSVDGWNNKTVFYDSEKYIVKAGDESTINISDDPRDNDYPVNFEYPQTIPFITPWYNADDGFALLGGLRHTTHSFRKIPYSAQYSLSATYATETSALSLTASADYRQFFGYDWHLGLNLEFANANSYRNFYGLGNKSSSSLKADSARVFNGFAGFAIPFKYENTAGWSFSIIPSLSVNNIKNDQSYLNVLKQPGLSDFTTRPQWYLGNRFELNILQLDDPYNPRQGFSWISGLEVNKGIANAPDDFSKIESHISFFISPLTDRQYTLAIRLGGQHIWGTFPFYFASTLGGTTNLRGYIGNRFSGRSGFFSNAEFRMNLFPVRGEILPGMLGILGFYDLGRVWTDQEKSNTFHTGQGVGLWYDIVNEYLVRISTGFSEEDTTVLFGLGFFF